MSVHEGWPNTCSRSLGFGSSTTAASGTCPSSSDQACGRCT